MVLATQKDPDSVWEGPTQVMNTSRKRSLGTILEAGHDSVKKSSLQTFTLPI